MLLAAVARSDGQLPEIICTILLFATVIAFILGLAEALGFTSLGSRVGGGVGRFGTLLVAIILLVAYMLFC